MAAFYLDEDVPVRLARLLRDRGYFAATTDEERHKGAPDARQLLHAAEQGWVLLTHNGDHYRLLHDAWLTWGNAWRTERRHGGILVLPHVVAGNLAIIADEIHRHVDQARAPLEDSLYEFAGPSGWRRWPREC